MNEERNNKHSDFSCLCPDAKDPTANGIKEKIGRREYVWRAHEDDHEIFLLVVNSNRHKYIHLLMEYILSTKIISLYQEIRINREFMISIRCGGRYKQFQNIRYLQTKRWTMNHKTECPQ